MIIQQKTNIRLKFEICSEHKVIKVSQCHMDFNSELYFRIKWWEEGPSIIVVELVYLRRSTKTVLIASYEFIIKNVFYISVLLQGIMKI